MLAFNGVTRRGAFAIKTRSCGLTVPAQWRRTSLLGESWRRRRTECCCFHISHVHLDACLTLQAFFPTLPSVLKELLRDGRKVVHSLRRPPTKRHIPPEPKRLEPVVLLVRQAKQSISLDTPLNKIRFRFETLQRALRPRLRVLLEADGRKCLRWLDVCSLEGVVGTLDCLLELCVAPAEDFLVECVSHLAGTQVYAHAFGGPGARVVREGKSS